MSDAMADALDRPLVERHGGNGARPETPIVPKNTIAGRALVAVVAIMTFLGTLTMGAVVLVVAAASEWQSDVAREMTIQVRPRAGRDIEQDVARAAEIAKAARGIVEVRAYTRAESARLLEPWLGNTLALDDLPVPRLIVVKLASGPPPDLGALRTTLTGEIPGASLDDHRGWIDRMRAMAGSAIMIGIFVVGLVLAATILSVTFATRGAMAANRPIVEVLHFIGATDGYIASQFQRHFLMLGLKGAAIGGGVALVLFFLARLIADQFVGTAGGEEAAALFGSFGLGMSGYTLISIQAVIIAGVTAWTSRKVVGNTLREIN
jgi:cell division transport system permease protein